MGTLVKSSKSVKISKQDLAETAIQADQDAKALALEGSEREQAGIETLQAAGDVARLGTAAVAAGASDLTRAVDSAVVADRLSTLSDVVETAGITDMSQGVDLLAHSEDVVAMSAMVGLMSADDLERGLEIARMAGELGAIGNVADALEMPVLSAVLADRGSRLQSIAVEVILQAAATRSLSHMMSSTGREIGEMGEDEIDEGVLRVTTAEVAAKRAEELATESAMYAARGVVVGAAGMAAGDLAREMVVEGASEMAAGAADMASSEVLDDMAQTFAAEAE